MSERIRQLFELTEEDFKNLIADFFKKYQYQSTTVLPVDLMNDLIPRKDVANLFGISLVTLAKWARNKILPKPIKKGGRVYYLRSQINQVIKPSENKI
ncbi:MAG: helix-turn-helix domain-containing protein [Flavobacteriales bacterium]|nr:helix-turn-helix domain-containing protein [Flavobacteriales bacterium]